MKAFFIFSLSLFAVAFSYLHEQSTGSKIPVISREQITAYKKQFAFSCSPDLSLLDFSDSNNVIPLLQGWGDYRMPITSPNDSAAIYFEQGINMYYGFHIIEALASFEKAIVFDSTFAMGFWGEALAYGPNINDYGYTASPEALTAMHKAEDFSSQCTPVEKELIDAMQVRYSTDTTGTRAKLDQLYADVMKKVYLSNPQSADAAVLYVDALMLQHPWDLYTKDYQPKQWTPEIVNTLESTLKKFPDHPGASHYYIHAIEASAHPEKGLAVAKKLPLMMPGVSHVVHMPSHIYIRSGYYKQGEKVNEQAVKGYYDYLGKFSPVANNSPLYLSHNLHMQATCANMDGRFAAAMKASIDCRNSFDSNWLMIPGFIGVFVQYMYMTPYLTQIRFGKWDDIISAKETPAGYVYANLLWHYGQGLAYARKHDFSKAIQQLDSIKEEIKNNQLQAPAPNYANPGINGATVALHILQGVIAEEENRLPDAIAFLQQSVTAEDSMIYNEPKDWVHPARQYLGNVLLKAGRLAEAEKVYKEDLQINPNNCWSLTGLATALSKEGEKGEAVEAKQKATKAFANSDVYITSSVY